MNLLACVAHQTPPWGRKCRAIFGRPVCVVPGVFVYVYCIPCLVRKKKSSRSRNLLATDTGNHLRYRHLLPTLEQCFWTAGSREILLELITNLNVILYLSTCHTVHISVLILFMFMPYLIINTYVSLMYELKKKMERYLRVNLLGPGPRLMKKEFTGPRSHKGWETLV